MTMLSPHDVADRLKISYDSALSFIKYSGIDFVRVGRQYRVSEDKLNAFLGKKGKTIIDLNQPLR